MAQRVVRCVVHDKKGSSVLYIKVQYSYNMRVYQVSDSQGLAAKLLYILRLQLGMQHFDSRLGLEIDMFA